MSATPAGPTYLNHLDIAALDWEKLAAGHEQRTTLRLRCLPARLCSVEALSRILREAGLEETIDTIRVFQHRAGMGVALVNAVDAPSVMTVARFFHGRAWGRGPPVAVSFSVAQGRDELLAAYPEEASTRAPLISKASRNEVKVIDLGKCTSHMFTRPPTSDASTDVDDSEVGSVEACNPVLLSSCPPPPGLEGRGTLVKVVDHDDW
eukprot:CAMPEP_0178409910 /NCGR_PEP_ID=MMETSP0689_2-20121128/20705_1 /TAXON_ID=160604 /ORGANISM="Amphidinium massartii, Strain CS-259" /LENGTH=206 /DNA_ID=CAMNT_0020031065 /DNA_START=42 /DNA_END=659 /DNA_ORIENTATION=-